MSAEFNITRAMKPAYHFIFEKDWRTAPLAFWVHIPVPGTQVECNPPAPKEVPHKGFLFLCVQFEEHELQFSAPAQLDHFIEVLSTTPLPTSTRLSLRRGLPVGPNSHWLSRLPTSIKSPRKRVKLVQLIKAVREQMFTQASNASIERTSNGEAQFLALANAQPPLIASHLKC